MTRRFNHRKGTMKFKAVLASLSLLVGNAAFTVAHGQTAAASAAGAMPASATTTTEGEVRKIDLANKKITLKHGEIRNLHMPGMTMVFQVKDPAMLESVKPGDKVMFKAEKANAALVVTEIMVAR